MVKYKGLQPGEYQLVVKSANADGIWSDEKLLYHFKIDKPFWMEYYFILSASVLLVLLSLLLIRIRFVQIKKKNQHLEMLVANRTSKIERQKQELENANIALEEKNSKVLAQRDQILAQRDHLLEMHAKLEEMNQLKQKFFTNISHDIKTPLALISAPLEEILRDKSIPENLGPKLKRMQTNIQYVMQLLDQILDKKKLEIGGMNVIQTHGDIVEECRKVVDSYADQVRLQDINLHFSCNYTSYHQRYDYEKLQQIVFNLMANAFKFTTSQGSINFRLIINKDSFEIEVSDTGIGIPADRIKYIFDRYYQVGKSSNKEIQGSGIGLSLVRDFVSILKGKIEVLSAEGKGSKFTIFLPYLSSDEQTLDEKLQDSGDRLIMHKIEDGKRKPYS
ncbi:MAG: HAMP domain-containing histidine kinase [Chloroflexia bacterium]|nr:HAMP domain-containing histidine kinase [Chloroflexia bacterium]